MNCKKIRNRCLVSKAMSNIHCTVTRKPVSNQRSVRKFKYFQAPGWKRKSLVSIHVIAKFSKSPVASELSKSDMRYDNGEFSAEFIGNYLIQSEPWLNKNYACLIISPTASLNNLHLLRQLWLRSTHSWRLTRWPRVALSQRSSAVFAHCRGASKREIQKKM